jgi:hypothetical protein
MKNNLSRVNPLVVVPFALARGAAARFALGRSAAARVVAVACLLVSASARSQPAATAAATECVPAATMPPPDGTPGSPYRLGAHAELDLGTLFVLKQGAAFDTYCLPTFSLGYSW